MDTCFYMVVSHWAGKQAYQGPGMTSLSIFYKLLCDSDEPRYHPLHTLKITKETQSSYRNVKQHLLGLRTSDGTESQITGITIQNLRSHLPPVLL